MNDKVNNFLPIIDTWPDYYDTLDEGLGTTYERFILHRIYQKIQNQFNIQTILEAPSFGMTGVSGINSLWWASQGKKVTVLDVLENRLEKTKKVWNELGLEAKFEFSGNYHPLPFPDVSFDFSWNFAALWFVDDMDSFFRELNRVSKTIIFICVPNHFGLGYRLRSLFTSMALDQFYPENILPQNILSAAEQQSWKLIDRGYFDIPLWPDIPMKKEDLLKKVGLGFLVGGNSDKNDSNRTSIVDYFNGNNPEMENQILKYSILEKAPTPIKQLWGHHRYFLFKKAQS